VTAPLAGPEHPERCPKCGLLWFYAKDASSDLACVYCGRVEYGRPPIREEPTANPPSCRGVVL